MSDTIPDPPTANANTLWAHLLVDELARCGLEIACISPGSRSTPLVVAMAGDERIDDISIIDERCAAFFALGAARATGKPTALVCTSGTAAANFFPAICEASASEVPLLVLTADRPARLQDCGASQAMDQNKLYGDRVRWFHQLGQAEPSPDKMRYARATACRAWAKSLGPTPGPVHLNVPFRKPLEPIEVADDHRDGVDDALVEDAPLAVGGRPHAVPFVDIRRGSPSADPSVVGLLADRLAWASRPLIVAGADHRGADYAPSLLTLAEQLQIPVIAEPTSGMRFGADSDMVISTGDIVCESNFYDRIGAPDLILRTGRAPLMWSVRRRIQQFSDTEQIAVCRTDRPADPDHIVAHQIIADETTLFDALLGEELAEPSAHHRDDRWAELHRRAQQRATNSLNRAMTNRSTEDHVPWAAADVWAVLDDELPEQAALFVSNSMPIRDADTFLCRRTEPLEMFFNRGINGIDGVVSSGLGVAHTRADTDAPTVIVVGDVALRHDAGALAIAEELDTDATVVVIDNDGGAIFEYLPIAGFDGLHRRHFATDGRRPVDDTAAGTDVYQPDDAAQLRDQLHRSFQTPGPQLIRVGTDRQGDKETRERLRTQLAADIDELLNSLD